MFLSSVKPVLEQIVPNIWRFKGQKAWGEEINCYLIKDDDKIVLIDSPNYGPETLALIRAFNSPCELYLTHAPASGDGELWQREGIPMFLHEKDLGNQWLRGTPSAVFSQDFSISSHLCAVHMPGHSPGHVMYLDTRDGGTIFSGDAILFKDGKEHKELVDSAVEKLKGLVYRRVLPLHHELKLS